MRKLFLAFGIYFGVLLVSTSSIILTASNKSAEPLQEYRPEGPLVLCKYL